MDITFTETHEKFRQEIRDFFENSYPSDIKEKLRVGASLTKDDYQRSERALAAKGWSAPGWPAEYGGPGWTLIERYIFDEELERAGALNVVPMGLLYLGPVVYTFGSDEQKARWLGDILHSRTFWAQGYSEPNSGSDLVSLRCSAAREGESYRVNGEKIWTSLAQHADWIFALFEPIQKPLDTTVLAFFASI